MAAMTFVALLVCVVGSALAYPTPDYSYIRDGQCLPMSPAISLNYEKFAGTWVEVASRPNIFRRARQCVNFHFLNTEDTPLRVTTGMDSENKQTEVLTELVPQEGPSSFKVHIQGIPNSDLMVVDSDYASFACVYQCQQATQEKKVEWAFVYARDLSQSDAALKRCSKVLQAQGFDVESLLTSSHPQEVCNSAQ